MRTYTLQYDYLAHAILGLGASHLSQHGNVDYTSQALQHRVTAMKLVNEQLDNPPTKPADADALFAAVVCLVAQSSLMPDSMIDYITTTRGGNLVATSVIKNYEVSIFKYFTPQEHHRSLERLVCEQPRNFEAIDGFESSALRLRPLCQKETEIVYCESMIKCINNIRTSSLAGMPCCHQSGDGSPSLPIFHAATNTSSLVAFYSMERIRHLVYSANDL